MEEVPLWALIAAAVPGIVALGVCVWLWSSLRGLRATQRVLLPDGATVSLAERQSALSDELEHLVRSLNELDDLMRAQGVHTEAELRTALRFQGLVRYDAYRDIGGEQSWSLALLDGNQTGTVVTSLHARDHARVYMKRLVAGTAEQRLSPEEQRAVELAIGRAVETSPPAVAAEEEPA